MAEDPKKDPNHLDAVQRKDPRPGSFHWETNENTKILLITRLLTGSSQCKVNTGVHTLTHTQVEFPRHPGVNITQRCQEPVIDAV